MDKSSGEWIPEDYETAKAMAQQALADAGYPNGEGFPTITYSTNDAGYHKAVAEYLQQCYKEVLGINLEIEIVEWSSFTRCAVPVTTRWPVTAGPSTTTILQHAGAVHDRQCQQRRSVLQPRVRCDDGKHQDRRQGAAFCNLHAAEEMLMGDYAMIPIAHNSDFWLQSTDLQGTLAQPLRLLVPAVRLHRRAH